MPARPHIDQAVLAAMTAGGAMLRQADALITDVVLSADLTSAGAIKNAICAANDAAALLGST